jgi:membrane protein implicated in regulation of membrane protease activity
LKKNAIFAISKNLDYMEPWIIWLIAFLLLAVVEVMTQWLTTFCLAVGCLVALICTWADVSFNYQLIALGISALVSFVFAAPYFKKLHQLKGEKSKAQSNMDALIGRKATVIEAINADRPGRVKVDGDNWQARSVDGSVIANSVTVEVVDYDSIILIVKSL